MTQTPSSPTATVPSAGLRVFSGLVLGFAVLALFLHAAFVVWARARLGAVLADFGTPLKGLTLVYLSGPGWLWPALTSVVVLGLVLKELLLESPWSRLGINLSVLLLAVLGHGLAWWAVLMPLLELLQGVSGNPR